MAYEMTGMKEEPITDREIDEIYDAMDALMTAGAFNFIDKFFDLLEPRVWRTPIDELLSYAVSTLPAKTKLKKREKFLETCRRIFPEEGLWDGL